MSRVTQDKLEFSDSSSSVSGDEVDDVETCDHSTHAEDVSITHTEEDPYRESLTSLFESVHDQVDDVANILGELRPYIVRLTNRDNGSTLAMEILEFIDNCISSQHGCTKAQLYAIAAFHNGNNLLLEDDGSPEIPKITAVQPVNDVTSSIHVPPSTQCDIEYTAFMAELDKFEV